MGVWLIKRENTYHIFRALPPTIIPITSILLTLPHPLLCHVGLCNFHVERRSSFLYSYCMPSYSWGASSRIICTYNKNKEFQFRDWFECDECVSEKCCKCLHKIGDTFVRISYRPLLLSVMFPIYTEFSFCLFGYIYLCIFLFSFSLCRYTIIIIIIITHPSTSPSVSLSLAL